MYIAVYCFQLIVSTIIHAPLFFTSNPLNVTRCASARQPRHCKGDGESVGRPIKTERRTWQPGRDIFLESGRPRNSADTISRRRLRPQQSQTLDLCRQFDYALPQSTHIITRVLGSARTWPGTQPSLDVPELLMCQTYLKVERGFRWESRSSARPIIDERIHMRVAVVSP